jgi:SAM-dependent methyltransferase
LYELVKNIAKKILPDGFLTKREAAIRKALTVIYKGSNYQCNVCGEALRKFIKLENDDLLCPRCGSLPRTRSLWKILQPELADKRILHFSPTPSLRTAIQQVHNKSSYLTTDFENEFTADVRLNIEELALDSSSFDIIICYHVLEHVIEDKKALIELFRVLANGGEVYIQTPFKEGKIYEDYSIVEPADRLQHFGQKDHVRVYSAEGLVERMNNVGFETEIIVKENLADNHLGLKMRDVVLRGRK